MRDPAAERPETAEAPSTAWLLHAGAAGFRVQCEGLAGALRIPALTVDLSPRPPWRWVAPFGPPCPDDRFRPPFPEIAIGSGRQAVPYMRRLQKAGAFTVFLQNPQVAPRHFGLVWAPAHDELTGDNVVTTIVSPHNLTEAKLAAAAASFADRLEPLGRPLIGVVVGGANGVFELGRTEVDRLAADLAGLAERHGAGIALTPSRRTGDGNIAHLKAALAGRRAWVWDFTGDNPYHAILARADWLLVTCDSVNMVGEAAFTGKPVYMLRLPGGSAKFERFHRNVVASGAVRWFEGALDSWTSPPLNATEEIARAVRRAFAEKTGKTLS